LLVVGYLIRWKGSFLELFLVGFYVFLVLRLKFGLTSTSIVGSEMSDEELQNLLLERQQHQSAFSQPAMNHQPQPVTNHQPQQVHPQPAPVTAPQQRYHRQPQLIPTPQQTYHPQQQMIPTPQQTYPLQQQQHQHYNPSNAPQQVLYQYIILHLLLNNHNSSK
jgi:DNA segregation ATPase FtsK/SpoIIIE-like protein